MPAPGTVVRIVYRPDQAEQLGVFPTDFLFPSAGRIATWRGVWMSPVAMTAFGGFLVALCLLSLAFLNRLAAGLQFQPRFQQPTATDERGLFLNSSDRALTAFRDALLRFAHAV